MTVEEELQDAIKQVLDSPSRKKLIVAGPGTGKTTLFRELLMRNEGGRESRLVLTFINNLKADLEGALSDLAKVFTLHGYCQWLLRRNENIRAGLSPTFRCLPGMASLIKSDWEYLRGEPAPRFVDMMRHLEEGEETDFYLGRANYYDAVDFDDSVFRVYWELQAEPAQVESYELVLIDEYQDFNRLEAAFINLLSDRSSIVIAGDDDQALYSQLRGASWDFIRELHLSGDYEVFELPFCMRCPEVIVAAVNDIIDKARELEYLNGRIAKPYQHYAPVKGEDSERYPQIVRVQSTVQRKNANYWGRYIEQAIAAIPPEEIQEASEKGDPVVLVIGSKQYLRQVAQHLEDCGYTVDTKRDREDALTREAGLFILHEEEQSNLGWRVILNFERDKDFIASVIREAHGKGTNLFEELPADFRERILEEARDWTEAEQVEEAEPAEASTEASERLVIKLTSFEGAKGLSAYHVFIVGMHDGEIPRNPEEIQDIEICRFVVALTRTRKKCSVLWTYRFAGAAPKRPSTFLSWIQRERYEVIKVDAEYWRG